MTAAVRPAGPLAAVLLCVACLTASCAAHDMRGTPPAAAARRLLQSAPPPTTFASSASPSFTTDVSFERPGRGLLAAGVAARAARADAGGTDTMDEDALFTADASSTNAGTAGPDGARHR
jgi:hypothetical protein